MSTLRALLDRLSDLESSLAKIEREQEGPPSRAIELTLRSLYSRRDELLLALREITRADAIDVCDYRIIPEKTSSLAITSIAGALQSFQELVSLVFDAQTGRAKERAVISPDVIQKTQFDFGYAYAGSLGLVLTIPNERLIAINSHLDESMSAVFELIRTRDQEGVRNAAHKFGFPVIRKLNDWARVHALNGMSFDLKWIREDTVRDRVTAEFTDMQALNLLIGSREDVSTESLIVEGELVAWNVRRRTFTLETDVAEPISGQWAEDFNSPQERTLPRRYRATITKRTVRAYSDEEKVTWALNALNDLL
jgi:hypothetical protein